MILLTEGVAVHNCIKQNMDSVLAIIAIIVSIGTLIFELIQNQRINRINLEAHFYEVIYQDFLIKKIPNARNQIVYNENVISKTEKLVDVLNDMRRKSLFFKYKDKDFYEELCKLLHKLEDELTEKSDFKLEPDEFCEFSKFVKDMIEDIYDLIMSKYTGKLFVKKRR